MKKILITLLLVSLFSSSYSTIWTITNTGTTFTPPTLTITLGDSVNFVLTSIHDAVEVSQATWNANDVTPLPGFSVPLGGGLVLPAQLTVGVHYYVCTNHVALFGMKGIITVQYPLRIIETSLKANISIFPNPSDGKFQLDFLSSSIVKNYSMEVFNMRGEKVPATFNLNQKNLYEMDISSLQKGIYFVKIYDEEKSYTEKIILL